jgi:hypothetical protein
MSIEQKIAELLEESAKLKLMEDTTEEVETISEEEFTQLDESLFEEDITLEELEDFMMSEDFEQLDELSKKTLGSYMQKASNYLDSGSYKHEIPHQGHSDMHSVKGAQTRLAQTRKEIQSNKSTVSPSNKVARALKHHELKSTASDQLQIAKKARENKVFSDKNSNIEKNRKVGLSRAADRTFKEDFNVQEDVDALLFGEDLTEEFKVKAATIFEAAVMARVNAEVETLEEAFEARLVEQAELDKEEIIEKVDGYLGYVVEQWMSDNEIAIENGLKSDILEGFVDGLKTLFVEHYIEVPEERFDIVGDLQEQVDFLESKLDESLEQNVQMMKELNEMTRDSVTGEFCSDMTDTEVEKFTALAEELSYEDAENFASKLQIIKENYFGKKPLTHVESVVTDSPVQLNEETKIVDANVARYLETFNRIK